MKPFVSALRRSVSSLSAIKTYSAAIATLDHVVRRHAEAQGCTSIYESKVEAGGAYILAILYSFTASGWGKIVVKDEAGATLLRADLDSESRYSRWLLRVEAPGWLYVSYEAGGGPGVLRVFAAGIKKVAEQPVSPKVRVDKNAVCAAIATYPQRRHMLEEAVASLAPQVDHLFVYLNNYRQPPTFLDTSPFAHRISYIVDTHSALRASAKFFWLTMHRCYWLLCDDDIIYPADYASRMMEALKSHGNRAVVGVHATIFNKRPNGNLCHHRIAFQNALAGDQVVHMLGTGTVALHSSIFDRRERYRLLRYPTQNDEILAVLCRTRGIPQIAVSRKAFWLRSNRRMNYGIFEETQLDPKQARKVRRILEWGAPWPEIKGFEDAQIECGE